MRRKIVAGNWKMHGRLQANEILLEGLRSGIAADRCEVVVCPPAPYLQQCQFLLANSSLKWGAQDLSVHEAGAYTGEISAGMLLDFGCNYVIVGHSERRAYYGESNELVAKKALRAVNANIVPIVCVGETLEQRESGNTDEVIQGQIDAVLNQVEAATLSRIVVAYEPVWAIGTGKTATPDMAQKVHAMLRNRILERDRDAAAKVRILYGGSVKPATAKELFAMPDIDGGLVGGASLDAEDFLAIVHSV